MTNQEHPITPPLEMVEQWADMLSSRSDHAVFSLAAQWGADQELEASVNLLIESQNPVWARYLKDARRPKPPSLKEQALKELAWVDEHLDMPLHNHCNAVHTIRRALEALPND